MQLASWHVCLVTFEEAIVYRKNEWIVDKFIFFFGLKDAWTLCLTTSWRNSQKKISNCSKSKVGKPGVCECLCVCVCVGESLDGGVRAWRWYGVEGLYAAMQKQGLGKVGR